MSFSLFRIEGDRVVPGPATGSPWRAGALNGAAVGGLMAVLAERHPAPYPVVCARMSLEFLRPVPDQPLAWRVEVLREGRKQQILRVHLGAGDRVSAMATFVRLKVDVPMSAAAVAFEPPAGQPFVAPVGEGTGLLAAVEARLQACTSRAERRGWLRFSGEIVAGVPSTPWSRMGLFADFGNGMAPCVDPRTHTFLNAELTLHLARLPRGDWLHLDCRTIDGGQGIGMTRTVFADAEGDIGYAHQALLFQAREA